MKTSHILLIIFYVKSTLCANSAGVVEAKNTTPPDFLPCLEAILYNQEKIAPTASYLPGDFKKVFGFYCRKYLKDINYHGMEFSVKKPQNSHEVVSLGHMLLGFILFFHIENKLEVS